MTDILDKLRGGDLRSIGKANEVAREVADSPELFKDVFTGLYDIDPVVRMRAADVIEKVTEYKPELLLGYSSQVISVLASAEQQEVCWHLAQISPRLELTGREERQLIELLKNLMSHKSKIVRVSAMESLTIFAERNDSILKEVIEIVKVQMKNGSPAILSRGRKLLQRLEKKKANA
jgi:HEAT repeat protein